MLDEHRRIISDARALNPAAVAAAAGARRRRPWLGPTGRLMIIAADHSARGVLAAGDRPMAMANRTDMLDRIMAALSRPGVDGILGSADVIDDLLLLGALDDKVVLRDGSNPRACAGPRGGSRAPARDGSSTAHAVRAAARSAKGGCVAPTAPHAEVCKSLL